MTARIDITDHAVLRYVERHAPGLSHVQARADIEHLAGGATPLKKRTLGGQQLWRVDVPPMLLVIKPDSGRYVCVTVLPPSVEEAEKDAGLDEEVVSAYERIRHLVERSASASPAETKALRNDVDALCGKLRERIDSLKAARETVKRDLRAIHAAATGDAPVPTQKGAEKHGADVLRDQLGAMQRKYEKQLAHGRMMAADRERARRLLAVALRGLARSGDPGARAAFDAIVSAEPWAASRSYWDREVDLTAQAGDAGNAASSPEAQVAGETPC